MSDMDDAMITAAMLRFGGAFVVKLAELYRQADDDNRRRLREAFPEFWQRYREMAELASQRAEAKP